MSKPKQITQNEYMQLGGLFNPRCYRNTSTTGGIRITYWLYDFDWRTWYER